MSNDKNRRIVAEFFLNHRGKYELFSLWVWEENNRGCSVYDVDLSKGYGYCYHMSGGGFDHVDVHGPYWTNAPELVTEKPCNIVGRENKRRNKTRRLNRLPKHLSQSISPVSDLLEWLEVNAIESDTEWCSICKDRLPVMDSDHPCKHIWWCETYSTFSTPSERMTECTDPECDCALQKETV